MSLPFLSNLTFPSTTEYNVSSLPFFTLIPGCICLNGAAARKCVVGDTVIIIAYALMDFEEAKSYNPVVVFPVDNKIQK